MGCDSGGPGPRRTAWGLVAVTLMLAIAAGWVALPSARGLSSNWTFEVVDVSVSDAGVCPSLVLDALGVPHIAYWSSPQPSFRTTIRYAVRNGSSWDVQEVVSQPFVWCGPNARPMLAIDPSSQQPVLSFANSTALYFARRQGTQWNLTQVEIGRFAVAGTFVNSSGLASIAYSDDSNRDVKFAYERAPGLWRTEMVESAGNVGLGLRARMASDGTLYLVYSDFTRGSLKAASRVAGVWRIQEWDPGTPLGPDIAFDGAGRVWLAYSENVAGYDYVHIGSPNGSSWDLTLPSFPGRYPMTLYIDSRGWPRMLYCAQLGGALFYARWQAVEWSSELVGGPGCDGDFVLRSDIPHVAYYNGTSLALYYGTIGADAQPPDSHVLPMSPYWGNAPRELMASALDAQGYVASVSLSYRYSADGVTWGPWSGFGTLATPPWTWTFPFADGDGHYEFYTTATDNLGNLEPPPALADAVAGYDATPPISSASPIAPYWHASSPLRVDANATDNLSGLGSVTLWYAYAPNNASWGPWIPFGTLTAPPWSWSFPFPDGEGNYRFHTLASDVAGNAEANKTLAEAIGGYRIPPDYAPATPSPSSPGTVGLSLPVTFSVSVANLGGTANATAVLAFYNASTPGSPFATVPLAAVAPGATSGPFAATWTSPATPGTYAVVADVDYGNALPESDESNNIFTWTVYVVPGPITTLLLGQPNATAGVPYVTSVTPLSFSVQDQGGAGIRATRYRVGPGPWTDYAAPFTLPSEGEYLMEWSSEDNAGNVESVRSAVLRVDDTPPTTTIAIGDPKHVAAETFITSGTPLALLGVDGGLFPVGLAGTEYRLDGAAAWMSYVAPFSLAGEGPHLVEYRSSDLLGNAELVRSATVVADDTPPAVTIDVGTPQYEGADTYVTSATPFTLTATDRGAIPVGIASVEVRVGGAWGAYVAPITLLGPDGPRAVEYRAADLLDNVFSKQLDVVLDNTPPVTTPSRGDGAYSLGTTFAFPATDAGSGVARTDVRIDDGNWIMYAVPLNLPEGPHTIRFRSVDRLHNIEAERTLSVTIEGAPPSVGETNSKPPVAAAFAAALAVVGLWSARRFPAKVSSRPRLRAFVLTALPFVVLEAATGVVSLFTGWLSIPPILGVGTAVDLGILVAGVAVLVYRVRMWTLPK